MIPLAQSIEEWCRYRRFTTADLARASGVEYNTIYRTLKGKHESMLWRDLYKIARALSVDLDQLANGCGELEPEQALASRDGDG